MMAEPMKTLELHYPMIKFLKGLGHAILGNFSTEEEKSNKTQESQEGTWMDKTGED